MPAARLSWHRAWVVSGAGHAAILALVLALAPAGRREAETEVVLHSALASAPERLDEAKRLELFSCREPERRTEALPAAALRDDISDVPPARPATVPDELAPAGAVPCRAKSTGAGVLLGVGRPAAKPGPGNGSEAGDSSGSGGAQSAGRGSAGGGGSGEVEGAIDAALKWLADHQNADGSWTLSPGWQRRSHPVGVHRLVKQPDGTWRPEESATEADRLGDPVGTGLALLAFSGAGCAEGRGRHGWTVEHGLAWLRRRAERNGLDGQGVAAWALVEAAVLSRGEDGERAAQRALDAGLSGFGRSGVSTAPGAWLAMAVAAAGAGGPKVSGAGRSALLEGYRACRYPDGSFSYGSVRDRGELKNGNRKGLAYSTAAGAAALQCLGASDEDGGSTASANRLLAQMEKELACGSANTLFMFLHHGTVAMRLMGGRYWDNWRGPVFKAVLAGQIVGGPDHGAWPARMTGYLWAGDDPAKGTVFATALGAMILEADLRISPVYR